MTAPGTPDRKPKFSELLYWIASAFERQDSGFMKFMMLMLMLIMVASPLATIAILAVLVYGYFELTWRIWTETLEALKVVFRPAGVEVLDYIVSLGILLVGIVLTALMLLLALAAILRLRRGTERH